MIFIFRHFLKKSCKFENIKKISFLNLKVIKYEPGANQPRFLQSYGLVGKEFKNDLINKYIRKNDAYNIS